MSTNCCRKDYDLQQFSYDSGCGYCYSTTDRKDECPVGGWEQDKNQEKPLGEDGGRCPDVMLPPWSYKSKLLTPKPEAYHHLHS